MDYAAKRAALQAWSEAHPTSYTIRHLDRQLIVETHDELGLVASAVYTARGPMVRINDRGFVDSWLVWTQCEDWADWIGGHVLATLDNPVLGTPLAETCELARQLYIWLHKVAPELTDYAWTCWEEYLSDDRVGRR
jgi:hypothetical protein